MAGVFHRLFVYGTLKRGQPNTEQFGLGHGVTNYKGLARTVQKWPLVIASQSNIPFLLDREGIGNNIIGEIYEVDGTMLQHLDIFEDCPQIYQRTTIRVHLIEDSVGSKVEGNTEDAFVYVLRDFKDFMLELPQHECYDSDGPHGLKYLSKYEHYRYPNPRSEVKKEKA